jgi:uncharacterized membrane protein
MAALAYLLPPLSGLLVYSMGRNQRARFHGLQAVVFGFLWPAAIYVGSLAGPTGTRVVFALGALVWIVLLGMTALGRDPRLPGGRRLRSLSEG